LPTEYPKTVPKGRDIIIIGWILELSELYSLLDIFPLTHLS